jgi:hypothetical protein
MTSLVINGQQESDSGGKTIITSLSDQAVLQARGGFLVKTGHLDGTQYLELLPYVLEGERTYHYTMHLPDVVQYGLSGFINTNRTLTLIPIVTESYLQEGLSSEQKLQFREQYRLFSLVLVDHGFNSIFSLDTVTIQVLDQIGYPGEPATVADLAGTS